MATPEHADTLQDLIERGRDKWPLPQEAGVLSQLNEYHALLTSDRESLKVYHQHSYGWEGGGYTVDPLPERIAEVWPDLIFGEDPEITAAAAAELARQKDEERRAADLEAAPAAALDPGTNGNGAVRFNEDGALEPVDSAEAVADTEPDDPEIPDQELLDGAIEENELPSQLQEAGATCAGEGEVWYRIYLDRDAYDYPCIEWHSRRDVIPLWRGRKCLAVAFVQEVDGMAPDAPVVRVGDDADPAQQLVWQAQAGIGAEGKTDDVWRYVEIQTEGMTRNLLYRGTQTTLGDNVGLGSREEFADLPEEWVHDLPAVLAGRVTNRGCGRLGRSQFHGIKDLLYALNEAADIGRHNARMTLRQRMVMPEQAARADGRRFGGEDEDGRAVARAKLPDDVILHHSDDEMDPKQAYSVLEYSFDAQALDTYDNSLTDKTLTRARVAPQLVGRATEGAQTGPALRARLLDTVLAANAKARAWDDALPQLLRKVQLAMALSIADGGYGYDMVDPDTPPVVTRTSALPEDEDAAVNRLIAEINGEILSRRSAMRERHPEWDDDRIDQELAQIDRERSPETPGAGSFAMNGPAGANVPAPGLEGETDPNAEDAAIAAMQDGAVMVFKEGDNLRVTGLPAPN